MKKYIFVFLLVVSFIILSGCSVGAIFEGNAEVKNMEEYMERMDILKNLIIEAPFLSDGETDILVYNGKKEFIKHDKVSPPPKGSVLVSYQDIVDSGYDGFLGYTSTSVEATYLLSAAKIYEITKEEKLLSNMKNVAEHLKEKVFSTNIEGSDKVYTLIRQGSQYDFKQKEWIEETKVVYNKDILFTILAMSYYQNVTGDESYGEIIAALKNTIKYQQEDIAEQQSPAHKGALYSHYFVGKDKFIPSWNEYPFEYTWVINELNKIEDGDHKEVYSLYMEWVKPYFEQENMYLEGIPRYYGIDGKGRLMEPGKVISTTRGIRTLAGLISYYKESFKYPDNLFKGYLSEKELNNWYVPLYIKSKNGQPSAKEGARSFYTIAYKSQIFDGVGDHERALKILLNLLSKQRLEGRKEVIGTWADGTWVNYEETFIVTYMFYQLNIQKNDPLPFRVRG